MSTSFVSAVTIYTTNRQHQKKERKKSLVFRPEQRKASKAVRRPLIVSIEKMGEDE
jgi:hypothetical protein